MLIESVVIPTHLFDALSNSCNCINIAVICINFNKLGGWMKSLFALLEKLFLSLSQSSSSHSPNENKIKSINVSMRRVLALRTRILCVQNRIWRLVGLVALSFFLSFSSCVVFDDDFSCFSSFSRLLALYVTGITLRRSSVDALG